MTTLQIESASVEPVDVTIKTVGDPTGALPSFQVTATNVSTPTGAWVNGGWSSAPWDAVTKRVGVISPTLGAAGAGIPVAEGRYTLWIRWGSVVKAVGTLVVT